VFPVRYGQTYRVELTLTLPTSGGLSVGIVHSRTQATDFFFLVSGNRAQSLSELLLRSVYRLLFGQAGSKMYKPPDRFSTYIHSRPLSRFYSHSPRHMREHLHRPWQHFKNAKTTEMELRYANSCSAARKIASPEAMYSGPNPI
jgi:hypothetical protein